MKMTALATEVRKLQNLHHQSCLLPYLQSASLEMLHTLLHQSAAPTPMSTNITNSKMLLVL